MLTSIAGFEIKILRIRPAPSRQAEVQKRQAMPVGAMPLWSHALWSLALWSMPLWSHALWSHAILPIQLVNDPQDYHLLPGLLPELDIAAGRR